MSTPKDGGPAFPGISDSRSAFDSYSNPYTGFDHIPGMSLRAYFAGQAMSGFLARTRYDDETFQTAAADAVKYADALIAELNRNNS